MQGDVLSTIVIWIIIIITLYIWDGMNGGGNLWE